MKWWHWLLIEISIMLGVIVWIYFIPDELELNLTKGFLGYLAIYIIESLRRKYDR